MKEKNKSMKTADRMVQKGMAKAIKLLKMKQGIKIEGEGSICRIGQILSYENRQKPFLVTGSHVSKTDFFLRIKNELKDCVVFDGVHPDPDVKLIEQMVTCYQEKGCDCLVAIGGGSSIDAMKACAARIMCPGKSLSQMKGLLKVRKKLPLMIAIPTTAGTGSECTIATVVCERNHKYAINDPCLCPDYAILDPCLSVSMTQTMSAYSGMDALTHAIEAYLNKPYHQKDTKEHCLCAIQLIFQNLLKAYRNPDDLKARANMLEASYQAGLAFTVACVGNVHALAHTFGGLYHVPHGKVNAILLPYILEEYGQSIQKDLAEIAEALGMEEKDERCRAQLLIQRIRYMNQAMQIPAKLEVNKKDIAQMAKWACQEANPLYPVPVIFDQKDFEQILQKVANIQSTNLAMNYQA